MDESEVTCDGLLRGGLTLWQPARGNGYRFNLDPVLLADFVQPLERAVDFGAGCGVLGLLLLKWGKAEHVTFVERQPLLAELCRRNVEANGFADRAAVVEGDLREVALRDFDGAFFNPPYFKANCGRPSLSRGRDEGRFERHGGLSEFLQAAVLATGSNRKVGAVLRAERHSELVELAAYQGLEPSRCRLVHARLGQPARHCLLELGASLGDAVDLEPPLYVHSEKGGREYSREIRGILGELEGQEMT